MVRRVLILSSQLAKRIHMEPITVAIDLAKHIFQVHFVEPKTGASQLDCYLVG